MKPKTATSHSVHGLVFWLLALLCLTFAWVEQLPAAEVVAPAHVQQGELVYARVPSGSRVSYEGRALDVTDYGTAVFGIGRDAAGVARLHVTPPGQAERVARTLIPITLVVVARNTSFRYYFTPDQGHQGGSVLLRH